jgi:hypothetical protein
MPTLPHATPPVAAVSAPLASAGDIRAAIEVLTAEAQAHDTLTGNYHVAEAAALRRVIALLRACLHHAGAGR